MAENKKSVLLYCDIIHTVEELSDEEAGRLFKHYLRYINDLNPVEPDKLTKIVFEPIKQNLKRDLKTWKAKVKKRSDAGKKGMVSRWGNDKEVITKDNIVIKPITNITDTVTVKDNVTVTVKEINNSWQQTQKDFFNCYHWIEKFCRDKKVAPDEMKRQMGLFITDVDLSNQVKDLSELQSHFLHCFNKGKYKKIDGEKEQVVVNKSLEEHRRRVQEANQ